VNHIQYRWDNTDYLMYYKTNRSDWIQICTSEGGLFEYGLDEDIIKNLNSLYENTEDSTKKFNLLTI
jgi:hypothetical protein